MGKTYSEIDDRLAKFIEGQKMFFVATAPRADEGHVNLSPKGLDTFRILDATRVAYLDLTGSGVETVAHLRENGRISLMFCAFEGPPNIVRLYGRGEVVTRDDPEFESLCRQFPELPGIRSVICVAVTRISDSCGFGVPLYRFEGHRPQLAAWAERKRADGVERYIAAENATSIDGLPGF